MIAAGNMFRLVCAKGFFYLIRPKYEAETPSDNILFYSYLFLDMTKCTSVKKVNLIRSVNYGGLLVITIIDFIRCSVVARSFFYLKFFCFLFYLFIYFHFFFHNATMQPFIVKYLKSVNHLFC